MYKFAGTLMLLAVLVFGTVASLAEDKPTLEQARKNFESADALLNKAYKEACAGLDKTKVAKLRDAERDWIASRDSTIQADFGRDDTAKSTAAYWMAMTKYAKERTVFLRAWPGKNRPVASAIPAVAATPAATATPAAAEKPTVEQARKTFENTDALLTIAYKETGAGLDPAKMAELRQKERDWIQYREMMAKSAPYFNNGSQSDSPKGTVDYWQTMNEITKARVDFLHAYSAKGLPVGLTGVYSDSYGGTLVLEEKKSGLAFSINTVRGMARNQGSIDGVAQRNGEKAFFKDHPDAGDDRPPCEITFTFTEGHIVEVAEKNGDYYHGFNASFDGTYYKTGKLEKPLRPE